MQVDTKRLPLSSAARCGPERRVCIARIYSAGSCSVLCCFACPFNFGDLPPHTLMDIKNLVCGLQIPQLPNKQPRVSSLVSISLWGRGRDTALGLKEEERPPSF